MPKQTLQLISGQFTVHSFSPEQSVPSEVLKAPVFFIGKTPDELSIVCPSEIELDSDERETDWRAFEVLGPLGFSLTGILSNISGVLAKANVSIFVVSTFDTDYILVKQSSVDDAASALRKDGYTVHI